jgi:hypothetical protein
VPDAFQGALFQGLADVDEDTLDEELLVAGSCPFIVLLLEVSVNELGEAFQGELVQGIEVCAGSDLLPMFADEEDKLEVVPPAFQGVLSGVVEDLLVAEDREEEVEPAPAGFHGELFQGKSDDCVVLVLDSDVCGFDLLLLPNCVDLLFEAVRLPPLFQDEAFLEVDETDDNEVGWLLVLDEFQGAFPHGVVDCEDGEPSGLGLDDVTEDNELVVLLLPVFQGTLL